MAVQSACAPAGSSPLTRGKHTRAVQVVDHQRLIPAHAGKTLRRQRGRFRARAHPRSRGENLRSRRRKWTILGSSPLTRGKRVGGVERGGNMGLIPAHAGKTVEPGRRIRQLGAHPRSRGENAAAGAVAGRRGGSSPLTRGKQLPRQCDDLHQGLIPAHAGKTLPLPRLVTPAGAHPRSRGENRGRKTATQPVWGSSPLTRGKRSAATRRVLDRGLIPAHAGKTTWSRPSP